MEFHSKYIYGFKKFEAHDDRRPILILYSLNTLMLIGKCQVKANNLMQFDAKMHINYFYFKYIIFIPPRH